MITDKTLPNFNILACISGRGSNLKSIIEQAKGYRVVAIVSDNPTAPGLNYGKEFGIPTIIIDPTTVGSKSEFHSRLLAEIFAIGPDLITLAGFMRVVKPELIGRYLGKIVNIHPALLPKLPGLDTHRRAIESGQAVHGCTVHFVDEGVDTGPIIAQALCQVESADTVDSLSAKVLKLEHMLYPWVISKLALGQIRIDQTRVVYEPTARSEAKQLGLIINEMN